MLNLAPASQGWSGKARACTLDSSTPVAGLDHRDADWKHILSILRALDSTKRIWSLFPGKARMICVSYSRDGNSLNYLSSMRGRAGQLQALIWVESSQGKTARLRQHHFPPRLQLTSCSTQLGGKSSSITDKLILHVIYQNHIPILNSVS